MSDTPPLTDKLAASCVYFLIYTSHNKWWYNHWDQSHLQDWNPDRLENYFGRGYVTPADTDYGWYSKDNHKFYIQDQSIIRYSKHTHVITYMSPIA